MAEIPLKPELSDFVSIANLEHMYAVGIYHVCEKGKISRYGVEEDQP